MIYSIDLIIFYVLVDNLVFLDFQAPLTFLYMINVNKFLSYYTTMYYLYLLKHELLLLMLFIVVV